MSLISGPGRGGAEGIGTPDELKLVVDQHVDYIKSLDSVRCLTCVFSPLRAALMN